jgi:hypothetical protein
MKSILIAISIVLLPLVAEAKPVPFPFKAVEGPFTSIDHYCERLHRAFHDHASCEVEPVAVALPTPSGPLKAIEFWRVHAWNAWHFSDLVLVMRTSKGLFVDERLEDRIEHREERASKVTSVEVSPLPNGHVRLGVRFEGITSSLRPENRRQGLDCVIDEEGQAACMDPGYSVD